jgi:hypothetical protein
MDICDGTCHNRPQLRHSEMLGYAQLKSIIILGALKAHDM